MKLKVLVENNTLIDQYYLGEPGISFYIEDGDSKILFDAGYSDILIKNALNMGISLQDVDTIVFSHGHNDHTAGFQYLAEQFDITNKKVVAHSFCFQPKKEREEEIGAFYDTQQMNDLCQLKLRDKPYFVSENIIFLGEIPSLNNYEERIVIGNRKQDAKWIPDYVMEDSALVYQDREGIFIMTGCSHSGICNIIEYAKKVCQKDYIKGVIGGFHLFEKDQVLEKTIEYFKQNNINQLYPCHCVSFQVKARMNDVFSVQEVGVGMTLEI
jgi:7,8-dihydropterin-6-yl-methyl-4-(beta-D-ribofuranosyl)aminobenzene 5'-phosphate synthase